MSSISFLATFRFFFFDWIGWSVSLRSFISWGAFLFKMTVATTLFSDEISVDECIAPLSFCVSVNSGGWEVVALNTGDSTVPGMLMSMLSVNSASGAWTATSPEDGFSKEVKISKGQIKRRIRTSLITRNLEMHEADWSQMSFNSKEIVLSREDIATNVKRRLRKAPDWSERLKELERIRKDGYSCKIRGPTYKPSNRLLTSIGEQWSSRTDLQSGLSTYPLGQFTCHIKLRRKIKKVFCVWETSPRTPRWVAGPLCGDIGGLCLNDGCRSRTVEDEMQRLQVVQQLQWNHMLRIPTYFWYISPENCASVLVFVFVEQSVQNQQLRFVDIGNRLKPSCE